MGMDRYEGQKRACQGAGSNVPARIDNGGVRKNARLHLEVNRGWRTSLRSRARNQERKLAQTKAYGAERTLLPDDKGGTQA